MHKAIESFFTNIRFLLMRFLAPMYAVSFAACNAQPVLTHLFAGPVSDL